MNADTPLAIVAPASASTDPVVSQQPLEQVAMDEEEEQIVSKKPSPPCEVCQKMESKYTCPACEVKFCSVNCCKKHKEDTKCTGVRDKTKFVALQEFNQQHFMSDYNFLEDLKLKSDSTKRTRRRQKVGAHKFQYHPENVKFLQRRLLKRGVFMSLLPQGMSKRANNTTKYSNEEDKVYWKIEIVFEQAEQEPLKITEDTFAEDKTLWELLNKYVSKQGENASMRQLLQKYLVLHPESSPPSLLPAEPVASSNPSSSTENTITSTDIATSAPQLNSVDTDNSTMNVEPATSVDAAMTPSATTSDSSVTQSSIPVVSGESSLSVAGTEGATIPPTELVASTIVEAPAPSIPAVNNIIDENCYVVFMKVDSTHRPSGGNLFFKLDLGSTIAQNLRGKTLIEHPTFFVVLPNLTYVSKFPLITEEQVQQIREKEEEERKRRREKQELWKTKRQKFEQRMAGENNFERDDDHEQEQQNQQ